MPRRHVLALGVLILLAALLALSMGLGGLVFGAPPIEDVSFKSLAPEAAPLVPIQENRACTASWWDFSSLDVRNHAFTLWPVQNA